MRGLARVVALIWSSCKEALGIVIITLDPFLVQTSISEGARGNEIIRQDPRVRLMLGDADPELA